MPSATAKYDLPWDKTEEVVVDPQTKKKKRVYVARYTAEQLAGLEPALAVVLGDALLAFDVAETDYQQILRLEYSYEYDEQQENGANVANLAKVQLVDGAVNAWVTQQLGG